MEVLAAAVIGVGLGYALAVARRKRLYEPGRPEVRSGQQAGDELARAVRDSLTSVQLGIVVFDSAGHIVYRNAAAELPEFGRHTAAVVNGEIQDLIAASLADAEPDQLERELVLYGPPKAVLTLRVLPRGDADSVGGVILIDDVSSERRLEEVRQSFVANVSHELRTPVGAIVVLAETLTATSDPDTIARLSTRLSAAANRLGDMIEDLLELSRTERADTMETEPLRITEVVGEAVSNLEESARTKGVAVFAQIEPASLSVVGDRRQLHSAVTNLLDNAIKYSESGGEVRVGASVRGQWIVLSVADEGIGIPETDLDRIYERFYRVDAARRRRTGGTGLGLSIVRHVAINHNGDVSVTSVEGEGSTFTIELPYDESDQPHAVRRWVPEEERVG